MSKLDDWKEINDGQGSISEESKEVLSQDLKEVLEILLPKMRDWRKKVPREDIDHMMFLVAMNIMSNIANNFIDRPLSFYQSVFEELPRMQSMVEFHRKAKTETDSEKLN